MQLLYTFTNKVLDSSTRRNNSNHYCHAFYVLFNEITPLFHISCLQGVKYFPLFFLSIFLMLSSHLIKNNLSKNLTQAF